jgi:HSP20 family molecular chaperone IbpA
MKEQSARQGLNATTPVKIVAAEILLNQKNEIQNMIARRAFELFESRASIHGHDVDDWIEAEVEVLHPYRHDLKESVEAVIFRAELSGSFTADQLSVSVEPHRLIVTGESRVMTTCADMGGPHTEWRPERIFRMEELPVDVDPSGTTAQLKGGTLEIAMPKVPAVKNPGAKAEAASAGR